MAPVPAFEDDAARPAGVGENRSTGWHGRDVCGGAIERREVVRLGELIGKSIKDGTLIDAGGLAPTSMGTRVKLSGGRLTVIDGPFTETKELVGSYAVIEFSSKEEAIEAIKQFLELHTTHWPEWVGECEVRQIFGPND